MLLLFTCTWPLICFLHLGPCLASCWHYCTHCLHRRELTDTGSCRKAVAHLSEMLWTHLHRCSENPGAPGARHGARREMGLRETQEHSMNGIGEEWQEVMRACRQSQRRRAPFPAPCPGQGHLLLPTALMIISALSQAGPQGAILHCGAGALMLKYLSFEYTPLLWV